MEKLQITSFIENLSVKAHEYLRNTIIASVFYALASAISKDGKKFNLLFGLNSSVAEKALIALGTVLVVLNAATLVVNLLAKTKNPIIDFYSFIGFAIIFCVTLWLTASFGNFIALAIAFSAK